MREAALVAAVAILTVTAGCQAFSPQAGGNGSPTRTQTTTVDTTPSTATDGDEQTTTTTDASGDGPNAGDDLGRPSACDYAALYNETAGSVVAVQTGSGQGSGFVYRAFDNETGYAVTNAHVVGSADSVTVRFNRGGTRTGEVVGRSQFVDLAAVRVGELPDGVEALPVADSVPPRGRTVITLGTPLGFEETMTHGIVSGIDRSLPTQFGYPIPDVIQTDAPINPGNSGGPLVTCDGEVVGVNTAGIAAVQVENVGFAISSPVVERVVPELVRTGEFSATYLGINARSITPALARANDLNTTDGVYVQSVLGSGPAADALQGTTDQVTANGTTVPVGGDVVVSIDGAPIDTTEDLSTYLLLEGRPGETVTVTVVRDGQRQEVDVTLGERPQPQS